jgi:hypothetical protein
MHFSLQQVEDISVERQGRAHEDIMMLPSLVVKMLTGKKIAPLSCLSILMGRSRHASQ